MSIRVQSLVWEHAPYRGNTLLALLALADWADDEGVCWPKMATLARKSRQTVRNANYSVEQLMRDGFINIEGRVGGRGIGNRYRISLQKLQSLVPKTQKPQTQNPEKKTPNPAKRSNATRKNRQEPP